MIGSSDQEIIASGNCPCYDSCKHAVLWYIKNMFFQLQPWEKPQSVVLVFVCLNPMGHVLIYDHKSIDLSTWHNDWCCATRKLKWQGQLIGNIPKSLWDKSICPSLSYLLFGQHSWQVNNWNWNKKDHLEISIFTKLFQKHFSDIKCWCFDSNSPKNFYYFSTYWIWQEICSDSGNGHLPIRQQPITRGNVYPVCTSLNHFFSWPPSLLTLISMLKLLG